MKTKILAFCILYSAFYIASCSSDTKNKGANKSTNENSADTSLHGLTGVIEQNPPVQQGDYIAKYPSGVVKMRGFYLNGKRNGQWVSFFESGNIQSEGFLKNGLRDGKATVYYEDGKILYQGYYKDGKETGKWIFYDESGKKINEKDYDAKPNL